MKFFDDLYLGFRRLSKSPSFSLMSVLIVVLGLALYLCSYSLSYNLTKDLPIENGENFVAVKTVYKGTSIEHFGSNFDGFAYNRLKEQVNSYSVFGVYKFSKLSISDGERPQQHIGAHIEPKLLHAVGIAPIMGRLFDEEDSLPDSQPVALLSHNIWQNYYAADVEIIGKTSRINGQPYQIVGVMPEKFDYPFSQQVWLTLRTDDAVRPTGEMSLGAMGVLAPGVTKESASIEMSALMSALVEEYPAYYSEIEANVVKHSQAGLTATNAGLLFELVTLIILLLATLNLGTLLLVRTNSRQKELAIRYAVGANRWEIFRQVLLESFILCAIGLLISLGIADFALSLIEEKLSVNAASGDYPGSLASWINLTIDMRALSIAVALTLAVWIASGSLAAYRAMSKDNNAVLAGGSKGGTDKNRTVLSRLIVSFEVTTSCFLLIVCCLLAAAIISTYRLDFGTPTENFYTGMFELRGPNYESASQRDQFVESLQSRLAERPETSGSTIGTALPGQFGILVRYGLEDRDLRVNNQYPDQTMISVADNYFEFLEVPLIEGRYFDSNESSTSPPVLIVNEMFAQSFWPGESALGKRVLIDADTDGVWHTVVGVTSHIIHGNPLGQYDQNPTLYRPLPQASPINYSVAVRLNQSITLATAESIISETAQNIDRDLPITSIRPLARVTEMSMAGMDLVAQFAIAFSLGTFVLAIIGVYGNISRAVSQRTNEIGIRRALGSSNKKVLWVFLREGVLYLFWGALIGGVGGIAISGVLAGYFNNILTFLPVVLPAVIAALVLLASYFPARKAISIEPGDALHYD